MQSSRSRVVILSLKGAKEHLMSLAVLWLKLCPPLATLIGEGRRFEIGVR